MKLTISLFTSTDMSRKKHPGFFPELMEECEKVQDDNAQGFLFNYNRAKPRFGLLLADMNYAIREGNGEGLLHLYRIALLIYKCHGHTKYAHTTLLFLTKVFAIWGKEDAQSLIWNRFCNSFGGKGKKLN